MTQRKHTKTTKQTPKKESKLQDLKPKKDPKGAAVGGGGGTRPVGGPR